jgi:hypothetical protein
MWPNMLPAMCTPSGMRGKTMVVAVYLRGDRGTGCFPFRCGG